MALSKCESIEPARCVSGADELLSHGFWTGPPIEDAGPGEPPVWPDDESVDEFLSFVHQQRIADLDSHQ